MILFIIERCYFHRKQFSFPKSLMAIDSAIFIFISLFFVGIHHLYSLDSKYLFVAYQAWQRNRKYQLILMTNYKFVVINYCMVSRLINWRHFKYSVPSFISAFLRFLVSHKWKVIYIGFILHFHLTRYRWK